METSPGEAKIRTRKITPDALVIDLSVEDEEMALLVKSMKAKGAKVIAMCGICSEEYEKEAAKLGVEGILRKPFQISALAQMLAGK